MKIRDAYRFARGMTATHIERAHAGLFRALFHTEWQRQEREDDALATLRALGDDGTHLQQAVALAAMGIPDDALDRMLHRYAQGDDT